jgi:hypothetical protein
VAECVDGLGNSAIFSLDERVTELERRPSGGGSGPVAVSITAESTTIHIQGTVSVVAFLDSADGAVQVNLQDGRADGQEVKCIAAERVNPMRVNASIQPASGPLLDHITFTNTGQGRGGSWPTADSLLDCRME